MKQGTQIYKIPVSWPVHSIQWGDDRCHANLSHDGIGCPFLPLTRKVWGLIIWAPSVRPSVRTSVDSDLSEVYGSNSLKLYTKIRYGLRIMHVK